MMLLAEMRATEGTAQSCGGTPNDEVSERIVPLASFALAECTEDVISPCWRVPSPQAMSVSPAAKGRLFLLAAGHL